jgi:outer membrane lipoprotein-sorting protein
MILVNLKKTKEAKNKIKKGFIKQKDNSKKMFRYTYPKGDVGIATLSLPNGDIYLYLPMFKKPKKITNLASSSKLNKSDFSFNDMSGSSFLESYYAKISHTNDLNYILDLTSINNDMPYNRLILIVNKKHFYIEKTEYYNDDGVLEKRSTSKYQKIDGHWVVNEVSMENVKKTHKTTIKLTDIKINQGMKDDEFTVEKLRSFAEQED